MDLGRVRSVFEMPTDGTDTRILYRGLTGRDCCARWCKSFRMHVCLFVGREFGNIIALSSSSLLVSRLRQNAYVSQSDVVYCV